jgi:Flp pilus assembly protein TadG
MTTTKKIMRRITQKAPHKQQERGQSLLEFAVIFPILILILMAIADLSLLYLTINTVEHASREGARMAVKLDDLTANDSRVITQVDNLIPDNGQYTGFTTITNTAVGDCSSTDQVSVTVSGTYDFVALNIIGFTQLNLSFPTEMRYELCD